MNLLFRRNWNLEIRTWNLYWKWYRYYLFKR